MMNLLNEHPTRAIQYLCMVKGRCACYVLDIQYDFREFITRRSDEQENKDFASIQHVPFMLPNDKRQNNMSSFNQLKPLIGKVRKCFNGLLHERISKSISPKFTLCICNERFPILTIISSYSWRKPQHFISNGLHYDVVTPISNAHRNARLGIDLNVATWRGDRFRLMWK